MRHRVTVSALGVLAALTLAACGGGAPAPAPDNETTPPVTSAEAGTAPAARAGCDLDLASTAFGPYTALNQIPTINADDGNEDEFWRGYPMYRFSIAENHFDPCTDLSWIRLSGTTRDDIATADLEHASGVSNAVVLFHRDELLTDPLPVEVAANLDVERLAENELELTFGHHAPPGEAVTQELQTLHLAWEDDAVQIDRGQWYADYVTSRTQLDLNSPPPGTDAPVLPLGNVRTDPFAEEYGLAAYPDSNFRIPLADGRELRCILRFPAEQPSWGWAGCLGEGAEWPRVDPKFGDQPDPAPLQPAAGETANYVQISYLPTMVASTRVDEAAAAAVPFARTVPDDALSRIEHYVVDTRGDGVTISYGGAGVRIDAENFETTTVHLLDQERWNR